MLCKVAGCKVVIKDCRDGDGLLDLSILSIATTKRNLAPCNLAGAVRNLREQPFSGDAGLAWPGAPNPATGALRRSGRTRAAPTARSITAPPPCQRRLMASTRSAAAM